MNRKGYPALGAALALGMLASTSNASTDGIEKWGCGNNNTITLTADFDTGTGTVKVGNTKPESATTNIEGLNRRWNWASGISGSFALVIRPNGIGLYYDFSEKEETTPSDRFLCSQLELKQSEFHELEHQKLEQQQIFSNMVGLGMEVMKRLDMLKSTLGNECWNAVQTDMFTVEATTHNMEENCTDAELERISIWATTLVETSLQNLDE